MLQLQLSDRQILLPTKVCLILETWRHVSSELIHYDHEDMILLLSDISMNFFLSQPAASCVPLTDPGAAEHTDINWS